MGSKSQSVFVLLLVIGLALCQEENKDPGAGNLGGSAGGSAGSGADGDGDEAQSGGAGNLATEAPAPSEPQNSGAGNFEAAQPAATTKKPKARKPFRPRPTGERNNGGPTQRVQQDAPSEPLQGEKTVASKGIQSGTRTIGKGAAPQRQLKGGPTRIAALSN